MKLRRKLDITVLDHLCHVPLIPLCQEELSRRDYGGALLTLEKADRLDGFQALSPYLTDRQYWRLLADIWTGTEFPSFRMDQWLRQFRSRRPGRKFLMKAAEQRFLARLPEVVRIYRVSTEETVGGMSWTVDKDVATFFKGYYAIRGLLCQVWTAEIDKRYIFAFLDDRHESEVVVDARHLLNIKLGKYSEADAA